METDPNAAAFHAVPLAEYTQVATFGQKVAANLMGALGIMCLLLAGMGLYSVMSYTREPADSGDRHAHGDGRAAGERDRDGGGQGMKLAVAGMAIGTVAAFAVTRLVTSFLIGVGCGGSADVRGGGVVSGRGDAGGDVGAGLPRHADRPVARPAPLSMLRSATE